MKKSYILMVMLVLVAGCSGGGNGTSEKTTAGGYPDVAGAYKVESSSCAFAVKGGGFNITQSETKLNISISSSSPSPSSAGMVDMASDESTRTATGADSLAGDAPSMGASKDNEVAYSASAAPKPSFSTSTITKDGDITIALTYNSAQYSCSGSFSQGIANLTCTSGSNKCLMSVQSSSTSAGMLQEPNVDTTGGASSTASEPATK